MLLMPPHLRTTRVWGLGIWLCHGGSDLLGSVVGGYALQDDAGLTTVAASIVLVLALLFAVNSLNVVGAFALLLYDQFPS